MNVEVGDKIRMIVYNGIVEDIGEGVYLVLEAPEDEEWVKVKHPRIGGYFIFKKERIAEVVRESG